MTAFKARLKRMVDNPDTRAGWLFVILVQSLIVVSLVTAAVDTLPDLTKHSRNLLWWVECVTVAIFTAEYLLRLFVADRPLRFVTSFFGIIDLLAILPFYLALGIDLRGVRAFRLLRLFRILKMARYSAAIGRLHIAFGMIREELALYLSVTAVMLYLTATGIYYFENDAQPQVYSSIFTSLYWGIVSLTSAGFGDMVPITTGGRIFTCFVLLIGMGLVSVPAGLLASALAKARELQGQNDTISKPDA